MDNQVNEPELPSYPEKASELDDLTNQVQANSLEPVPNDLCDKLISEMSHKGLASEASPKLAMMSPCGEKGHTPVPPEPGVPGKGYFLISGSKLSSGRVELIKSDPDVAMKSEKGCGYPKCDSTWWDSLETYTHEYPKEVMCEQRENLHSVLWADPEQDGCREHQDSPVWSHPNMAVRMCLKYLEKAIMAKWRARPDIFNVVSNQNVGKTSSFLLEHKNWILMTYRQLLVWGRSRDFAIDLKLVEVVGLPTDLIAFIRALQGVPVGSLPGPEVGAPKSRLRVLKVSKRRTQSTERPTHQALYRVS